MTRLLLTVAIFFVAQAPGCPWARVSEPYEHIHGEFHTPPEAVYYGDETPFSYRFVFTPGPGGPGSGAAKRFGEMECHYRVKGEKDFLVVTGKRLAGDKDSITVDFKIPPVKANHGDTLEYYSGGTFDGSHFTMKHDPHRVPIRSR
jgi:hypothetical protein